MLLGVREGGDTPLVYGCEVCKKHVQSACPAVRLLGGALYVGILRKSGGAISSPVYHRRRVVCILSMAFGGCRLRGS